MSDPLTRLERADERCREARAAVEERGEAETRELADAYREFAALIDRYEERATDWDDFEGYLEFQEKVVDFVEGLDEGFPERDAFEAADDIFHQRRLSASDFAEAREELAGARAAAERIEEWEDAREAYGDARRAVRERMGELDDRIEDLERLRSLGEADLDAPTERLREPIEAYNDGVRAAFRELKRDAPARECLNVVAAADAYPLVDWQPPADRLLDYVRDREVGSEPIPQLLEYADYSNSKLDHYVDDPGELKRHVATERTYLDRLDADPLTVDWPPPAAAELRFRCEEYLSVAARFAEEGVLAALREVRSLPARTEYGRLRSAARARTELTDAERERIAEEDLGARLETVREERERLRDALAEYPER